MFSDHHATSANWNYVTNIQPISVSELEEAMLNMELQSPEVSEVSIPLIIITDDSHHNYSLPTSRETPSQAAHPGRYMEHRQEQIFEAPAFEQAIEENSLSVNSVLAPGETPLRVPNYIPGLLFTCNGIPGLYVSQFLNDRSILDDGDKTIPLTSEVTIVWTLMYHKYEPQEQRMRLSVSTTFADFAEIICRSLVDSHLRLSPEEPSSDSDPADDKLMLPKMWLISFGRLNIGTTIWGADCEVNDGSLGFDWN
ncbi:hypothetical protein QCA50_006341 [Cerrena zonata]|uniref:Uncharacterized protein n=1 Tax=Cerrena zonata TaxID=2478898 RepID=A0AAW0GCH3_9APHY